jgi:CelD/BcsL family acetyltransferase involved in cellulose biosynthesis
MNIGHGNADYKRFWAKESHIVNRAIAGRGLRGYLIAISYYATWKLAEINRLRLFIRRIKRIPHNLKNRIHPRNPIHGSAALRN